MPTPQLQPKAITLEQYEALPENTRIEIFDGLAYAMAGPSEIHQRISMFLINILYNYIDNKPPCLTMLGTTMNETSQTASC